MLADTTVPVGGIRYDKRLVGLEERDRDVLLCFENGSSAEADIVTGAGGVNSVMREHMPGTELPRYTGYVGHRALSPASALAKYDFSFCWSATRCRSYEAVFALCRANRIERASRVQKVSHDNTWLRTNEDPAWVFGYDVFKPPLVEPAHAAAWPLSGRGPSRPARC